MSNSRPTRSIQNIRIVNESGSSPTKKLHVTLVRGPIVSSTRSFNNEATPCLALALISAYLKKHGFRTCIIDAIGEGLSKTWEPPSFPNVQCKGLQFEEVIERIPPETDVVAFSGMFSGEWPILRKLITEVRKAFPRQLFVAGGEHVSALPEYSLRDCRALDYCVIGEGEYGLRELLETHLEGKDPSSLASVAFLDEHDIYQCQETMTRIRTMDDIPWPDWPDGYLEKFWEAGKSYGVCTERDMPFMVSRGCPYQCTFCSSPQMWSTRYFLRSVENAIAEIKYYLAKYRITSLQFYDLTAIIKKDWIIHFCNALLREKIDLKWSLPSGTRSEALDAETLSLIKRTGCTYLVYAPESGSPATLRQIKKQIRLPVLTASVLEAKKQGLVVRTNLIIGFPNESRRQVYETLRYGLYLAWHGVDEPSINIFSPYPGSELFNDLVSQKRVRLDDDYFLKLSFLNSDYTRLNPLTFNSRMGAVELAIYRITFMLLNYVIGYLRFPRRILRTIRNLRGGYEASTVLEHRLRDKFRRKNAKLSSARSGGRGDEKERAA